MERCPDTSPQHESRRALHARPDGEVSGAGSRRLADTRKGNRPSFSDAASPDEATSRYEEFCSALAALGVAVERGVFGAKMQVSLVNDGPVTIVLD